MDEFNQSRTMSDKRKKIRVDMRKNRENSPRNKQWGLRESENKSFDEPESHSVQRVKPKGDLSRKRTVMVSDSSGSSEIMPEIDRSVCLLGRVLRVHGLLSVVETEEGRIFRCTVRRLLKSLSTDERSLVTCGDRVWIRPEGSSIVRKRDDAETNGRSPLPGQAEEEASIERVEPRTSQLTRASRNKIHAIVANIDQVVFVLSLKEPNLKLHLIDRYLASAIRGNIPPVLCLNKADLVQTSEFLHVVGLYSRIGIRTYLTSTKTGQGISNLKDFLVGKQTVFSGQSGVGKSSLLNAIQPGLSLRIREVSDVNSKGKHTTTTAELIRLETGGWVVDTPGIRQFELSGVRPGEVESFFPEFHPFIANCKFPGCTHLHESGCAVIGAVVRRQVAESRYKSYKGILGVDKTQAED
jgi:ribosome biogenesis GTPase